MISVSKLLAAIEAVDREYRLGHCERFHVRCAGRRRGVETIRRVTAWLRRAGEPVPGVQGATARGAR